MSIISETAISSAQRALKSFCKFISPNDCGKTDAHQSGYYIPKNAYSLLFDQPGVKGSNKDRFVQIKWQNDFTTDSRFIYYGTGTRNEYRLTRFGKGFPYLTHENLGNLLVLSQMGDNYYEAYVLSSDDEFEDFFAAFNITANETNRLIEKVEVVSAENRLLECFDLFVNTLNKEFPSTFSISSQAWKCYNLAHNLKFEHLTSNPDKTLIKWLDIEYQLFKSIELTVYADLIKHPFKSIDDLVVLANTILNRRKSRAGKSLEHHLAKMFDLFNVKYTAQGVTEGNKRPDFIFPSIASYHDMSFDKSNLIFLASKTTCKDRWRQIINEANRVDYKYLFTLQQGISFNQLKEMQDEGVKLVVPKEYINSFSIEMRNDIQSLDQFINFALSKQ